MPGLYNSEIGTVNLDQINNKIPAEKKNGHCDNINYSRVLSISEDIKDWHELLDERYKILIENSIDIISILDSKGSILYYSPSTEEILGYNQSELIGNSIFDYIHPEDLQNIMQVFYASLLNSGKKFSIELRFLKADGSYAYLESSGVNLLDNPSIKGIIINSRDITKRKSDGLENQRLKTAVEQSYESIVITDTNGDIQYVNRKFEQVTGFSKAEVLGKKPSILKSGFTGDEEYKELWETISSGKVWEGEFKNKKKDGTYYWESAKITPVKDENGNIVSFIAIKGDISEQKRREDELVKALDEKEIMLREIHHRVKNNLQIISSLLKLQSDSASDPELKAHLRVSRNRIKSMALIHQQLFNSPDLRHINMDEYLYSLSGQVYSTYNETPERVGYKADANGITFNVETAIPFGLILSELISNSLKFAFTKRLKGYIKVDLFKTPINTFKLVYKDDGIGIPYDIINGTNDSSGIFLIKTLVNQLNGNVRILNSIGTTFEIEFSGLNHHPEKRVEKKSKNQNNGSALNMQPSFIPFTKLI